MYRARTKAISGLHRGLADGCRQLKPHLVGFLCPVALALSCPCSWSPCRALKGALMHLGVGFFPALLLTWGNWSPKSDRWRKIWREQVLVQFSHFARTRGVKMEKMLITPRTRRGFCIQQTEKKMRWLKYISYQGVLQKITGCSPDFALSLLGNCKWSRAIGLGTLCKVFTKKKCSMTLGPLHARLVIWVIMSFINYASKSCF